MRMQEGFRALAAAAFLAAGAWAQQSITLTGVVRDFEDLKEGQATGGHPDFNPNQNTATNREDWGCFDRPDAAKGAVQTKPASTPANPDNQAGFVAYDRDEAGPVLKAGFDAPPNCFRSRFGEWYTTRKPEINRAFFLDLTFNKEGSVYKYDNSTFFPIDNDKLAGLKPQVPSVTTTFGHRQTGSMDGVDLASHNYGFTFEFHAKFTYKKGTGQDFRFRGDDDVWVFINDSLVIDLGGLHPAEEASVNLDNMALADGKVYYLDFFFAERRVSSSRLTISTSLELQNPVEPPPPPPPPAVAAKAVEGWLYDRDGDGIADKAEIAFDKAPAKAPSALELDLAGESAKGNWDVTLDQSKATVVSRTQFFSRSATAWDENDPANRGRVSADADAGIAQGDFTLHDRVGPVIDKAWKLILDTNLNQVPKPQIRIRFSEPVAVGAPGVLKFRDEKGVERQVILSEARPDSSVGGRSVSWTFTIAPGSPDVPGEGWKVAISGVDLVKDAAGNPAHPANPWRLIEAELPKVVIGDLRAEPGGHVVPGPDPVRVSEPFIVLTSSTSLSATKDYIPLHPETSDEWIKTGYSDGSNPGLAVLGFKISHPARLKLVVYDNLGQYVNEAEVKITREDLQSGKLARDPATRAFLVRLAWFPVSRNGDRISSGVYILRAVFTYGLDPRDYVERGTQTRMTRFGFVREHGLVGTGAP